MSRYTLFRNLPTRIACRVRAGVFVAVAVGLSGAGPGVLAQRPRVAPPPKRNLSRPNAQPQQQTRPMERPAQPPANPAGAGSAPRLVDPGHPAQMQMHLGAWMEAHRNLPLEQQHAALDAEPGFRNLRPEEQAQLHQRLNQLNRMPPEKLNQTLRYTEIMEHFSPPQRQQVKNVLGQLGSLPEDRQRAVTRAYRQLRDLPEDQRQAYMNSPQFRAQFNDQERATVGNMVNAGPLLRAFDPPPKD